MDKIRIKVNTEGEITFIYRDDLRGLLREGEASIRRVSNVEPDENGDWIASMSDGTTIGPFTLRTDALNAEVAYLEKKMFSSPERTEKDDESGTNLSPVCGKAQTNI